MPKKSTGYRTPKYRAPKSVLPRPFKLELFRAPPPPPYGQAPPDFGGSLAEWAVFWALEQLHEEFDYQRAMDGGRLTLGGTVVDFFIPSRLLIIRVQGTYWHYERGELVVNSDSYIKNALESKGYTVIDIDDTDALKDPLYFVTEALQYRDHSKGMKGI